MIRIIQNRRWWYLISLVTLLISIVGIWNWKLPMGIDFKGGTLVEIQTKQATTTDAIQSALGRADYEAVVAPTGQGRVLIRTKPINEDKKGEFSQKLREGVGEYTEFSFQTVGPTVSADITRKAIMAVIFASFGIVLFIAWAFRRVPKPVSSWQFGLVAIIALLHDLATTVGVFAIVAHYRGFEVDSLFITALLTVLGFSVHDTIVIFDRIRENLRLSPSTPFEDVTNYSVVQTLGRSLGTSLTVLFVLTALYAFGGTTIRGFVFTLLFGIFIGTYSSIFIAAPLLVSWQGARLRRVKHVT